MILITSGKASQSNIGLIVYFITLIITHSQLYMNSEKEIKHRLIDKILSSNNETLLVRLDRLLESSASGEEEVILTKEQRLMLQMSDQDIENGDTISQEELNNYDLKWLREK